MADKINKTDTEWRKQLTPNQYYVTRQRGTEPPFTGEYCDAKQSGTYLCVCCGQPLFDSKTKFESGTGWPSFTAPAAPGRVDEETDSSFGMVRTEAK
jgi:peptide-methionine (R)-S-oxide reductase